MKQKPCATPLLTGFALGIFPFLTFPFPGFHDAMDFPPFLVPAFSFSCVVLWSLIDSNP